MVPKKDNNSSGSNNNNNHSSNNLQIWFLNEYHISIHASVHFLHRYVVKSKINDALKL